MAIKTLPNHLPERHLTAVSVEQGPTRMNRALEFGEYALNFLGAVVHHSERDTYRYIKPVKLAVVPGPARLHIVEPVDTENFPPSAKTSGQSLPSISRETYESGFD